MQQVLTCVLKLNRKKNARSLPTTCEHREPLASVLGWECSVVVVVYLYSLSASVRPVVGARALGMSGAFISNASDSDRCPLESRGTCEP